MEQKIKEEYNEKDFTIKIKKGDGKINTNMEMDGFAKTL